MLIQQLTKHYGAKRVVDEVSFEIPKGKVLSLIGPNGAGKSTVMGMISRLVAKDAGLVHFEGKDLAQWNSRDLSKRLAILTQSNNIQMKLTVHELVSFGRFPYSQGRLQEEDRRKVDEALAYMELEAIADQFIDELSGGQRQRAMIGMVTSSNFNTLGNGSRCSLIGNEIGFTNLANDIDSTHGNESSMELLVKLNPEYIFVLDRDSAINTEGAKLAEEVMNNELTAKTLAAQNGNIVYLTPTVWYLAEGGITALDVMLQDLEAALLK